MSLLTALQAAAVMVSLPRPSTITGSTSETQQLLLDLARREAKELSRRHEWAELQAERVFSALAAETQTGMVPTDFDRMIPDTFWNRSARRKAVGPLSPQDWQYQKGWGVNAAIEHQWMRRGADIVLTPAPAAGEELAFEYIRSTPVRALAGTLKAQFDDDSDTFLLDEEILTLGVAWRYLRQKGLDYAEELKAYEWRVAQSAPASRGSSAISIGGTGQGIGQAMVAEGDW